MARKASLLQKHRFDNISHQKNRFDRYTPQSHGISVDDSKYSASRAWQWHTDSVFSINTNPSETELISGSADGVWKIWSLLPGDGFGECIHSSEQLKTKHNAPIAIYYTQFSPDGIFIFVVTDIGRIMIFLRETLRLQTNLYDKYQNHMQSSKEPNILSLLIDSEEKCFYVGYANGKMQKWA